MQERLPVTDRRITFIILDHWNKTKGDRLMPAQKELDPSILEQVLDNCYLVNAKDFAYDGKYSYTYMGKNLVVAYDGDLAISETNINQDVLSHKLLFKKLLSTKAPIVDEGEFVNKNGKLIKYRQCLVPLSDNGRDIDTILGGIKYMIAN